MRFFKLIVLCVLLISSGPSFANEEARKEAEQLLNIMELNVSLEKTIAQLLEVQIKQKPQLLPYKQIMILFLNKHMSFDSIKSEMIDIYSEAFTATELKEISAFYKTPTGAKTLKKMPELVAKGAQLGAKRVADNALELRAMIKAETERLEKLKNQSSND